MTKHTVVEEDGVIKHFDEKGNLIYIKTSNIECWKEYDRNNRLIRYENGFGDIIEYNKCGEEILCYIKHEVGTCRVAQGHTLYIVICGNPFTTYTGTTTFTGLNEKLRTTNKKKMEKFVKDHYDECGGLFHVVEIQY